MAESTIDSTFSLLSEDHYFNYEPELTERLDSLKVPFDQSIINQIVLWKIGRFAEVDNFVLNLINAIDPLSDYLNVTQITECLGHLLKVKGIGLPMASTVLRFRNPNLFQIIDQRVYRLLYPNKPLSLTKTGYNNEKMIKLYLNYLIDLRNRCQQLNIPFKVADRVLFMADKRINNSIPIKY